MAKIVIAWELGGGQGHIAQLKPVVEQLLQQGHEVTIIAKDSERVQQNFDGMVEQVIPSPTCSKQITNIVTPAHSIVQLMYNIGFGEVPVLGYLTNQRTQRGTFYF